MNEEDRHTAPGGSCDNRRHQVPQVAPDAPPVLTGHAVLEVPPGGGDGTQTWRPHVAMPGLEPRDTAAFQDTRGPA